MTTERDRGNRRKAKNRDGPKSQDGAENVGKYSKIFQEYRKEIDSNHDRYERLVKLSRDCTVKSKRVIFTLHQFSGGKENRDKVLGEAWTKIDTEIRPLLRSIAKEIREEGPYRHHRAFSPGLQEFIEALSYYKYLECGRLISLDYVQEFLTFRETVETKKNSEEEVEKTDQCKDSSDMGEGNGKDEGSVADSVETRIILPLGFSDFLLGLADLTGELMRLCINSVGSGNRELPFSLLPFFRALYCGFHGIGPGIKYMSQKMTTLRASLGKVENVCYTLKVRGSEIPKQMLMDINDNGAGEY